MEEIKTIKENKTIRKIVESEPLFTDRAEFFEMFKGYLTDKNVFVRSIGLIANWGEGKSFFINQLNTELAKDSMSLVFNAWKYDKYIDPLHALISFINDTEKEFPDYFNEIKKENGIELKASLALSIPFLTIGVSADKEINSIAKVILDLTVIYDRIFEQILNKVDYLFIDELDRCNPEFALNVIELFKHFCIDNNGKTKLIFAFDKYAIGNMIKTRYGDNNLSCTYLQKILEVEFELPKTDNFSLINELIIKHLEIKNSSLVDKNFYFTDILLILLNHYDFSVREIIDFINLLSKKEKFVNITHKNFKKLFSDEYVIYLSLIIFILIVILKNKNYEKYLLLIKYKDMNTLIKEIDSIKLYRGIIEKWISYHFNNAPDAINLPKDDFDRIIYIIFLGSLGIITEKTNQLYGSLEKLKIPFDSSSLFTFNECEILFKEI